MVVNSGLETIVLNKGFLEIVITGRVLGGFFLFLQVQLEGNRPSSPVNHWIVLNEPVISKD